MPGQIAVVFGAAFTVAASWSLGRQLLMRVKAPLAAIERELFAGIVGAALLSLVVFLCCVLHLATGGVFGVIGAVAIGAGTYSLATGKGRGDVAPGAPLLKLHKLTASATALFAIPYVCYAAVYLSNSLAPENSPDGMTYHLGLVYRYFRHAGFERFTTNMYEHLSKGMEMLYLFAFAFGRHAAAATVHCAFLLALPLLMLAYGRRIGRPWAGICAAMLVYLSPVSGVDGVSAYVDVALAAAAFTTFYLVEIWRMAPASGEDYALLISIGLAAGFCFAIKFTGFIAILYATVIILFERRPRALAPVACAATMLAAPWLIKNWIWTGNPAAPFFNRLFPNPYVHASFESAYRRYFATYNLPEFHSLPWKLTVSGELGGQIGPLFLLAPLGILALRSREGRHCLLAAAFFLAPYPANIGARFLIPALPFLALALAFSVDFSRSLISAMVMIAAVFAWPRVIRHYSAPAGGWQISTVPWQAAVGLACPEQYLWQRSAEYRLARMIDRNVPADGRVWSTMPVAEAYERPDVLVSYQSAAGELLEDILMSAIDSDRQPLWNLRFTFPQQQIQSITFEQTAQTQNDIWSIGEVKFYFEGAPVQPPVTYVTAKPFAWDARLAIDGNPLTRWRSWDSIRPGMQWSAEFARPVMMDRAELHCAHDQWAIAVRIRDINAQMEKLEDPHPGDLRALAAKTVKSRGIGYILAGKRSRLGADIAANPPAWRLKPVAESDGADLYRID